MRRWILQDTYRREDSKVIVGEIPEVARVELHARDRFGKKFLNGKGSAVRTSGGRIEISSDFLGIH